MNYSEFLKMGPEIVLVLALVIMFIADFMLHNKKSKNKSLFPLMEALLVTTLCGTFCTAFHHPEPVSAFGDQPYSRNELFQKYLLRVQV